MKYSLDLLKIKKMKYIYLLILVIYTSNSCTILKKSSLNNSIIGYWNVSDFIINDSTLNFMLNDYLEKNTLSGIKINKEKISFIDNNKSIISSLSYESIIKNDTIFLYEKNTELKIDKDNIKIIKVNHSTLTFIGNQYKLTLKK